MTTTIVSATTATTNYARAYAPIFKQFADEMGFVDTEAALDFLGIYEDEEAEAVIEAVTPYFEVWGDSLVDADARAEWEAAEAEAYADWCSYRAAVDAAWYAAKAL